MIHQPATRAVVQLVGVVVHEDVPKWAQIERVIDVMSCLKHQDQRIRDNCARQIHPEDCGQHHQRNVESGDRSVDKGADIAPKEVENSYLVMSGVFAPKPSNHDIPASAVVEGTVDPIVGTVREQNGYRNKKPGRAAHMPRKEERGG